MSSIRYRPDIDGLRAIAVIPVLFFHLNSKWVPGGYLGVDVFFVISGYLIGKILLKEVQAGEFSFRKFWWRRIKRLFPVSAAVIATSMIVGYFTLFEDEWKSMALQALTSLLCISNVYFWKTTNNYWGETAENMPFLHTWSLSIEEQFYLFFPLFLFFITRFLKNKTLIAIIIVFAGSLLLSLVASITVKSANFYLLPTRAWELLAGSILAAALTNRYVQKSGNAWIPTLGLLSILLSYTFSWNETRFTTVGQLLAVCGTVMIIWKSVPNEAAIGRMLSSKPIVFIGKISYSLYLWHWPLIVISNRIGDFSPWLIASISMLLATLSYFYIEQTTRYLTNKRFYYVIGGATGALAITLSLPLYTTRDSISYEKPDFWSHVNLQPIYTGHFENQSGDYKTGLMLNELSDEQSPDILVLGDSHSLMFIPAIKRAADTKGMTVAFYGADGGTSPFLVEEGENPRDYYGTTEWTPKQRLEFDHYRIDFINKRKPKKIIVCGAWSSYYVKGPDFVRNKLESLVDTAPDAEFIFIGQPPILPMGGDGFKTGKLDSPILRAYFERAETKDRRTKANNLLKQFSKERKNVSFVPTEERFDSLQGIVFMTGGKILYKDSSHLSVAGAMNCLDAITQALKD